MENTKETDRKTKLISGDDQALTPVSEIDFEELRREIEIEKEFRNYLFAVGDVIRHVREHRNLTQFDLAKISGISRATIANIELANVPDGARIGTFIKLFLAMRLQFNLQLDTKSNSLRAKIRDISDGGSGGNRGAGKASSRVRGAASDRICNIIALGAEDPEERVRFRRPVETVRAKSTVK